MKVRFTRFFALICFLATASCNDDSNLTELSLDEYFKQLQIQNDNSQASYEMISALGSKEIYQSFKWLNILLREFLKGQTRAKAPLGKQEFIPSHSAVCDHYGSLEKCFDIYSQTAFFNLSWSDSDIDISTVFALDYPLPISTQYNTVRLKDGRAIKFTGLKDKDNDYPRAFIDISDSLKFETAPDAAFNSEDQIKQIEVDVETPKVIEKKELILSAADKGIPKSIGGYEVTWKDNNSHSVILEIKEISGDRDNRKILIEGMDANGNFLKRSLFQRFYADIEKRLNELEQIIERVHTDDVYRKELETLSKSEARDKFSYLIDDLETSGDIHLLYNFKGELQNIRITSYTFDKVEKWKHSAIIPRYKTNVSKFNSGLPYQKFEHPVFADFSRRYLEGLPVDASAEKIIANAHPRAMSLGNNLSIYFLYPFVNRSSIMTPIFGRTSGGDVSFYDENDQLVEAKDKYDEAYFVSSLRIDYIADKFTKPPVRAKGTFRVNHFGKIKKYEFKRDQFPEWIRVDGNRYIVRLYKDEFPNFHPFQVLSTDENGEFLKFHELSSQYGSSSESKYYTEIEYLAYGQVGGIVIYKLEDTVDVSIPFDVDLRNPMPVNLLEYY